MITDCAAFIIGSGYNAHGLARSLWLAGIPCYGIVDQKKDLLRRSRFFQERLSIQSGGEQHVCRRMLLDSVQAICASGRRVVVLPTDERWTDDILRFKEEYTAAGANVPYTNVEASRLCLDKGRFRDWCEANQFLVPRNAAYAPGSDWCNYLAQVDALQFPIVLKPNTKSIVAEDLGFDFYKLFRCNAEFKEWSCRFLNRSPQVPLIAEQFIDGPVTALVSLQGYVGVSGTVYCSQYRKLSQTERELGCGNVVLIESVQDDLLQLTMSILNKLCFRGFFDIEYKLRPGDGKPVVIEINPRPCMINFAATQECVNLAELAVEDTLGNCISAKPCHMSNAEPWIWHRSIPHFFTSVKQSRSRNPMAWLARFWSYWREPYIKGYRKSDPIVCLQDPVVLLNLCSVYLGLLVTHPISLVRHYARKSRWLGESIQRRRSDLSRTQVPAKEHKLSES